MHPPKMPKQVHTFLALVGYYRKCYQEFCENSQTINTPNTQAGEIQLHTDSS